MATKAESISFAPSKSSTRSTRSNPLRSLVAALRRAATATQMGPNYSTEISRHTGGRG